MRRAAALAVVLLLGGVGIWRAEHRVPEADTSVERVAGDPAAEAFRAHRSDVPMTLHAQVVRTLADDRSGTRHQRFLIRTATGIPLLVAHNIDLAPRVPGLQPGEPLELRGEYVWNPQGGLLHWTHHDPSGRHAPGYIKRGGHRYD